MMAWLQLTRNNTQIGKILMAIYHLTHRTILRLTGENPTAFLQDILTADNASLSAGQMRQSCLLSPQGRILVEMTIYMPEQSGDDEMVYIACDERQSEELVKKLKLYRLRRKITISICEDLRLIASDAPLDDSQIDKNTVIVSAQDERMPSAFYHHVIRQAGIDDKVFDDVAAYHSNRILNAIPEGPDELIPNRALMLEAGLDIFNAVDFKKGCYIGQEVTARTRYRGLVKRRLVPVIGDSITAGMAIMAGEKEVGSILTSTGYDNQMIGLASIRLADIHAALDGTLLKADGKPLQITLPDHLLPLPKAEAK